MNGLRESVLNFEDGVKAVSPQEVIELMMVSLSSPADTVILKFSLIPRFHNSILQFL